MTTQTEVLTDEDIVRLLTEDKDSFVYLDTKTGEMHGSYVEDFDVKAIAIRTVRKILKEYDKALAKSASRTS